MTSRFIIIVEAIDHDGQITPAVRVRAALKAMKRRHGLRCLDVREAGTGDPGGPGGVDRKAAREARTIGRPKEATR